MLRLIMAYPFILLSSLPVEREVEDETSRPVFSTENSIPAKRVTAHPKPVISRRTARADKDDLGSPPGPVMLNARGGVRLERTTQHRFWARTVAS